MIEKKNNNNNSSKSDSAKLIEGNAVEIPNFKLLYRNAPNPERDKSSGVSSDEETTSSSLVPIPDTLKKFRNKSKWTVNDTAEYSEVDTVHVNGDYGKPAGSIMNSLEELRKKYTLKNETSVALKMNSANLMLDDLLNGSNLNKASVNNHQPKFIKKEEFRQKTDVESDISTTETSVPRTQPCPGFVEHSHIPIALDFYSSPCPRHCSAVRHLPNSEEKGPVIAKTDAAENRKKKSFIEKFQDLQFGCRLQSVYKSFQKTRNPFTKTRKNPENSNVQGIPISGCQDDVIVANEPSMCKCEHNQFPKKMILDLIESSETSQTDVKSTEREEGNCICMSQTKCNCPEVIPNCVCVQHIQVTSEGHKHNSFRSEVHSRFNESIQGSQSVAHLPNSNENESSLLLQKENEYNKKQSTQSPVKHVNGWRHCSKERNLIERTDIYYFDHGNSAYYQTTDNHPMRYTECLVERTDEYATKFWAEFFGTIEIGVAFLTSFFLQLYRFLFTSIIRSLTVGLLQIFSDYFFKPLLTIIFNGIIQPCLILAYNIATSVRDLCLPISEIFGFFAKEVANILKSFRLADVNHDKCHPSCHCENKV